MKGIDTTKPAQVAIIVKDLDSKLKAWKELLGVEPTLELTTQGFDPSGTLYEGKPTEARIRVAVFSFGEVELELMEPIDGPSVWLDQLEQHGDSLHHIGFMSDSLKDGIESFASLGIGVAQQAEYPVGYYAYFRSEEKLGAMVELNEMKGIPWPSST